MSREHGGREPAENIGEGEIAEDIAEGERAENIGGENLQRTCGKRTSREHVGRKRTVREHGGENEQKT